MAPPMPEGVGFAISATLILARDQIQGSAKPDSTRLQVSASAVKK